MEGVAIQLMAEENCLRLCQAEGRKSVLFAAPPPIPSRNLNPQLYHRGSTSAFVLCRFRHRFHVWMLLQILPKRFPQNAHAAAVHDAHPRQSR